MAKQQKTEFSLELSSFRDLFEEAKARRLVVTDANGGTFVNVGLIPALFIAVIVPQLVAIFAIIAVFKGMKAEIARVEEKTKRIES